VRAPYPHISGGAKILERISNARRGAAAKVEDARRNISAKHRPSWRTSDCYRQKIRQNSRGHPKRVRCGGCPRRSRGFSLAPGAGGGGGWHA